MSTGEPASTPYTDVERRTLLDLARASIARGLDGGEALAVDTLGHTRRLRETRATFVTLQIDGRLRGCIGSLEPFRPLAVDVARNAHAAAFSDPRFPPLAPTEFAAIAIHVSVLGPRASLPVASEAELLAQLRPGIDGLVLEDCGRRATFLPAVWEQLPDPVQFLAHLRRKAGLAPDHWTATLRFWRYTTDSLA